jgi:hypothetical protein
MKGPWYISVKAARDYIRIRRWADTEETIERATNDLIAIAREIAASGKRPEILDGGLIRYRTGRAHGRMGLVISTVPRHEGDLPQLVGVTRS